MKRTDPNYDTERYPSFKPGDHVVLEMNSGRDYYGTVVEPGPDCPGNCTAVRYDNDSTVWNTETRRLRLAIEEDEGPW